MVSFLSVFVDCAFVVKAVAIMNIKERTIDDVFMIVLFEFDNGWFMEPGYDVEPRNRLKQWMPGRQLSGQGPGEIRLYSVRYKNGHLLYQTLKTLLRR